MTERVLIITKCEQCPYLNFDDAYDEKKWGKIWCDKLDRELISDGIPDDCPLPLVVTPSEINIASSEKEAYHLAQMSESFGDRLTPKFAAMCCGNSFAEGAEFIIKKMKRKNGKA